MTRKRRQRIVCVDTQTLVWYVRKKGPDELREYARNLFQQLDGEKDEDGKRVVQIIVPTVVVTEFVTPLLTPEERDRTISEFDKSFLIVPFDVRAASIAAGLWHIGKSNRDRKKTSKHGQRITLRADTMIVATAKVHGANVFYSEDEIARQMADSIGMSGKQLPRIAPSLFRSDNEQENT